LTKQGSGLILFIWKK